jgi:uncharacterized membrane protein YgdD (TMEM256/DUF423 family)
LNEHPEFDPTIRPMSFHLKSTSLLGALGVGLGAFGAHGLKQILEAHQTAAIWQTASLYHLLHSVALLAVCSREQVSQRCFWCFTTGILIFSGSLYTLAVTNVRWLGAITPVGGLLLIAGWLLLFFSRDKPFN